MKKKDNKEESEWSKDKQGIDKTILVIDDEKELCETMRTVLEDAGFRVLLAENGVDGLDKALSYKPDLIFLDIVMPLANGVKVLTALRKDEWGAKVPVFVMTVVGDMEEVAQVVEHQGNGYIMKTDIDLGEIVDLAKRTLNVK